jgi:hypothetical protein
LTALDSRFWPLMSVRLSSFSFKTLKNRQIASLFKKKQGIFEQISDIRTPNFYSP